MELNEYTSVITALVAKPQIMYHFPIRKKNGEFVLSES